MPLLTYFICAFHLTVVQRSVVVYRRKEKIRLFFLHWKTHTASHLAAHHGEQYAHYTDHVRRWL